MRSLLIHWRSIGGGCALVLLAAGVVWRAGALAGHYRRMAENVPRAELVTAIQQAVAAARAASAQQGPPVVGRDSLPADRSAEPLDVTELVAQLRRSLADMGLQRIDVHRFDPDAAILVTAGADGQPGQAGYDDDQDGEIDGENELGAVYSDDQCLAPTDPGYRAAQASPRAEVISRGAYVPVRRDQPLSPETQWRLVLHGTTDGQPWVWPIEPPRRTGSLPVT